ncbi:MAG: ankyrin repeat domain-containing protein, partial [Candidatus Peregrinibacteria bacterium]|nr:ankyrin repeat domain-containing protein [Candidatus Peregrinibacteria bacterium]
GVDPSAWYNYAVRWAAENGYIEVVKYLCSLPIERGVDPSAWYNEAVRWAAENGHIEVVKYLCSLPIGRGVDPSAEDNHAVREAAKHGHIEVVKYLMTRVVKMKEIKWKKGSESRLTRMYEGRDMRVEVMVVREIMRMKWKIPYQMMERVMEHLFKMKVYESK